MKFILSIEEGFVNDSSEFVTKAGSPSARVILFSEDEDFQHGTVIQMDNPMKELVMGRLVVEGIKKFKEEQQEIKEAPRAKGKK